MLLRKANLDYSKQKAAPRNVAVPEFCGAIVPTSKATHFYLQLVAGFTFKIIVDRAAFEIFIHYLNPENRFLQPLFLCRKLAQQ